MQTRPTGEAVLQPHIATAFLGLMNVEVQYQTGTGEFVTGWLEDPKLCCRLWKQSES